MACWSRQSWSQLLGGGGGGGGSLWKNICYARQNKKKVYGNHADGKLIVPFVTAFPAAGTGGLIPSWGAKISIAFERHTCRFSSEFRVDWC